MTLRDGEAHYDDDAALYYIIMSQKGDTALAWASYNGHLEVVKVLLIAGADKEAKDKVGGNGKGWSVWGVGREGMKEINRLKGVSFG